MRRDELVLFRDPVIHAVKTGSFPRIESAIWTMRLLEKELLSIDSDFFEYIDWCLGIKDIVKRIAGRIRSGKGVPRGTAKKLREIAKLKPYRIANQLDDLVEDSEALQKLVVSVVMEGLAARAAEHSQDRARAMKDAVREFFGLDRKAADICAVAFLCGACDDVTNYFEFDIDAMSYGNRRLLSVMTDTPEVEIDGIIAGLCDISILDPTKENFRLTTKMENAWKCGDPERLPDIFAKPAPGKRLPLDRFSLKPDIVRHARALVASGSEAPVHILLYGAPGTGKTTFAASLIENVGLRSWTVACEGGDDARDRRLSLAACFRFAGKNKGESVVIVDEAEKILDTQGGCEGETDTAWLNPFLEEPGSRAIWIVNDTDGLADSVKRRFSYSIRFSLPAKAERERLWNELGRDAGISPDMAARLAERYAVEVAAIEQSVIQMNLKEFSEEDPERVAARVLDAHLALRNKEGRKASARKSEEYGAEGVRTSMGPEKMLARFRLLDKFMREDDISPGMGAFLFYGPPGTGKTEFARYAARDIGREIVSLKGSDLLSAFVGETEKNIARAFADAAERGSVLVVDEVDGFLQNRANATRNWEITGVNEFLTALEDFRGIVVCTTNLLKDMDPAAMRRFSTKVEFFHCGPDEARFLYERLLAPLVGNPASEAFMGKVSRENMLSPGDFHAVRMQFRLEEPGSFGHEDLFRALVTERRLKLEERPVGFTGRQRERTR